MKHASNGREEFQQQANKGKNLHAQRAEEVKVLMSARNAREGKLFQSEIDRMVQEVENYRDEDEANKLNVVTKSGM